MRKLATVVLAAICWAGCGGGLHPDTVREKKLSELSEAQLKGLCTHNLGVYRDRFPREAWATQHCLMVTVVLAHVHAKEFSAPLEEQCKAEVAPCFDATGTAENDMGTEQACEHVELDKARSCDASVSLLQECLAVRNDQMVNVHASFKSGALCKAEEPLKLASVMEGPACQKLLAVCKESGLGLPRHLF